MKKEKSSVPTITGDIISELRKEKGLTQRQFATALHISTSTLSHYEQGVCFPPHTILSAIADYFHVPVDYLLGRCSCRIEYTRLSDSFYHDMSIGDVVNLLAKMNPRERQFFYLGLSLLNKEKN